MVGNSLVDLNLSQNFLESISFLDNQKNSLYGLNQLRTLNLSNNQIRVIQWDPKAMPNISLKFLDLSYNSIEDLRCIKMFEGLTALKV